MADIKALIKLMKELEYQVARCVCCGMCQAVCPLFEQTGRESDAACGKLALLDGLMQEMIKNPKGVPDRLDRCLLCGSCAAKCPSGVSVLEIFIKTRVALSGFIELSPSKKGILRGMLVHSEMFDWVLAWGSKFQKIFIRPANDLIGTSCVRFVSPLLSRRHFLPLAPVPFHPMVAQISTGVGTPA
jgi:glycolate oxidase iron-sulfur subunit